MKAVTSAISKAYWPPDFLQHDNRQGKAPNFVISW